MFMPEKSQQRKVPAIGSPSARIAIVGDYSDAFDLRAMKPFNGPSGGVLEACLHQAGLIRGECYITTLIKDGGVGGNFVMDKGAKKFKGFTDRGQQAARELYAELSATNCNVIVAAGDAAACALAGVTSVNKFRGYFFESTGLNDARKVMPVLHPRDSVRGQYLHRYMTAADFRKAKAESYTRELKRPERQLIYRFENVGEVIEWLEYYENQAEVCFDIEVINYAVSCISFSSNPAVALVVPIAAGWTLEEELMIWRGVQRVLGNPNSEKSGQNLIFDIQFLLSQCGIVTRGPIKDTMIGHSVAFPELQKGLGFLGSIYCGTQGYWKDKVSFKNIKDAS